MPQPVTYNPGTPVSGSIQENSISYVVDGQNRNYRGGFGGLSWMSEVPAANNVIFIGNSTSLGRGPANIPLFYPSYNNSAANIIYAANTLPGSPRNFTTTGSAYNWAATNNFFINNSDNPIPRIDADGLVLYVDANQPTSYPQTSTSVYDLSGRNNNGTLFNNTGWNSNGWFTFDGTDDYINCGNNSSLAIVGDITIYALVYFNSFSGYNGIAGKTSANSVPASYDYYTTPNNPTSLSFLRGNGSSFTTVTSNQNISLSRWHQIAVTMNGTNVTHYLNGTSNGTGILSTTIGDNGDPLLIGNRGDFFTDMNGNISSVQIYSKALTESEVKQNYFQGNIVTGSLVFMVDANNLVSYPKSGTTAYALTGSNNGTLVNGVAYGYSNGGYWNFDGTDDYINIGTLSYSNNITLEAWVNTTNPTGWDDIIAGGCGDLLFGINSSGNGTLSWGGQCNVPFSPVTSTISITDGNWHHVIGTYNGSVAALYIDGNLEVSGARSGNFTPGNIAIGSVGGGGEYFNGKIANVRIYNKALSSTEVQQNYQATKDKFLGQNIVTNGLLLNLDAANKDSYPGTGTTWYTLAGSNNGTLNGNPTYNTRVGGTFQFNGPSSFDYVSVSDTITHKTGQSFSYECWVYFNGLSGFDKTIVGKPGCNIGLMQAGSSMGMAVFGPNGVCAGGNTQYYAAGTSNTGVWEHWIGTYEVGVGIKSFKNGTLVSSVPVTGNIGNWGDTLYIGGSINSNYTGECYIAYTSTYSIALNQNQVTQNFNALRNRFGV